jgi:hypothetical protein
MHIAIAWLAQIRQGPTCGDTPALLSTALVPAACRHCAAQSKNGVTGLTGFFCNSKT